MISESEMLNPVLTLFPLGSFYRYIEVPLGRKRIDLVCIPRGDDTYCICIELKINNWKNALWQATINFQLGTKSYIAIWHEFVPRVLKNISILNHYGVGLIVVKEYEAFIYVDSNDPISRSTRNLNFKLNRKLGNKI